MDRADLRAKLFRLLALDAAVPEAPVAEVVSDVAVPGGTRIELLLDGRPATYLAPEGGAPCPAVLYAHAHGGDRAVGRAELTEGARFLAGPWGGALMRARFAVLCLDMPGFGARQCEGTESALAKAGLWYGRPLFGRMLADLRVGLSWLAAQNGVDAGHIATLGMSMGAAHAFWLGALDERVGAVVQMCILADLRPLIACGAHDRHGLYLTVPGLLKVAEMGDVAGLVAPRPQFVAHGAEDGLAPEAAREAALRRLRAAYRVWPDDLSEFIAPETGHLETPAMRKASMAFLRGWARNDTKSEGQRHA